MKRIFDPSSGGMGTRLNIPKLKLTRTIEVIIKLKPAGTFAPREKRNIRPKKIAIEKFANTPAPATAIVPHFLLLKLSGLYGTGFAQPIKNGD